jgi:predicted metalloprotease
MDLGDYRRSEQFEDRGTGRGGQQLAGGMGIQLLFMLVRFLGWKKTAVLASVAGLVYFVMPASVRSNLLGGAAGQRSGQAGSGTKTCELSESNGLACDFSRAVLASTEDAWSKKFAEGALPSYGSAVPTNYQLPTLVVFDQGVATNGCGNATSDVGPFYCPADNRLYIDPSFYSTMEQRLKAPGDFAQAYVIAHEVGHHIQNLIGSSSIAVRGETQNQTSVRVELQADCLAGVWGHSARASLSITEADLKEALQAAHAIGDDNLGHQDEAAFTHGSSAQRMRWFGRGFEGGDAKSCDTFSVKQHSEL